MTSFSLYYKYKSGKDITMYPSKHSINTVDLYSDKSCKTIVGKRTAEGHSLDTSISDHIIDVTFSLTNGSTLTAKYTREDKKEVELSISHTTGNFKDVKHIKRKYLDDHIREVIFEY